MARKDDACAKAAFLAAYSVFMHPRCMNCHPVGDSPLQGDDSHPHEFGVKRGPDGKWHDAILGGNLTVKAGQTVTVTVSNYDDAPHTYTVPSLNLNERIPGRSGTTPGIVKFTFKAPSTAGSYQWFCALPCDPWSMTHDGYMRGHVTVTTA